MKKTILVIALISAVNQSICGDRQELHPLYPQQIVQVLAFQSMAGAGHPIYMENKKQRNKQFSKYHDQPNKVPKRQKFPRRKKDY